MPPAPLEGFGDHTTAAEKNPAGNTGGEQVDVESQRDFISCMPEINQTNWILEEWWLQVNLILEWCNQINNPSKHFCIQPV